jgi:hypothetical protein
MAKTVKLDFIDDGDDMLDSYILAALDRAKKAKAAKKPKGSVKAKISKKK